MHGLSMGNKETGAMAIAQRRGIAGGDESIKRKGEKNLKVVLDEFEEITVKN